VKRRKFADFNYTTGRHLRQDLLTKLTNRGSSVSIKAKLRDGRPGFNSRLEQWWETFITFVTASRPALEPTQPPIE